MVAGGILALLTKTKTKEIPRWWQLRSFCLLDFDKDKDKDTDKGDFKMVADGDPCLLDFDKDRDKYKGEDKCNFKSSYPAR